MTPTTSSNYIVLIVAFILCISNTYAQLTEEEIRNIALSETERELDILSVRMLKSDYYLHAEMIVDRLLEYDSEKPSYNYRKGFILYEARRDFFNATFFLNKAKLKIDKNFNMFKANQKGAPSTTFYYLGLCQQLAGNYDDAISNLNTFLEYNHPDSTINSIAKVTLEQCYTAKALINNPVKAKVRNMGDLMNSNLPEYSPTVSLDGNTLFFTSRRKWENGDADNYIDPKTNLYPEDIYVSYRNEAGIWSSPEMVNICKPERNEATISVSADKKRLFIYDDLTGQGDIYYSNFVRGNFKKLKPLNMKGVNSEFWETHCTLSRDAKHFIFASDRPGGYGGRDLYYMYQIDSKKWSNPINLGPNINTKYDEDSPFLGNNDKTLFFSSNSGKSMGGFDVFKSTHNNYAQWSSPQNLGYPINSPNDDIFYTSTFDGTRSYLSSFRPGGYGEKDIYEILSPINKQETAFLDGQVLNSEEKSFPDSVFFTVHQLCIDCDQTIEERYLVPNFESGKYESKLVPCKTYEFTYYKNNVLEVFKDTLITDCDDNKAVHHKKFVFDIASNKMTVIPLEDETEEKSEEIIAFTELNFKHFFEYNENIINNTNKELQAFFEEIEKQMEAGRDELNILINASVSRVATRTYKSNKNLVKLRAENMVTLFNNYFGDKPYFEKMSIQIESAKMNGPKYKGDYQNIAKYRPFQYVSVKAF